MVMYIKSVYYLNKSLYLKFGGWQNYRYEIENQLKICEGVVK